MASVEIVQISSAGRRKTWSVGYSKTPQKTVGASLLAKGSCQPTSS